LGVIRKFREKPFSRCAALAVESAGRLRKDEAALGEMVESAICSVAADVQRSGGFSNAVWDFAVVGIWSAISTANFDVQGARYRIERLPSLRGEHEFHQANVAP
jgi:hypothetical protein